MHARVLLVTFSIAENHVLYREARQISVHSTVVTPMQVFLSFKGSLMNDSPPNVCPCVRGIAQHVLLASPGNPINA